MKQRIDFILKNRFSKLKNIFQFSKNLITRTVLKNSSSILLIFFYFFKTISIFHKDYTFFK